jgi:hypothetical protein
MEIGSFFEFPRYEEVEESNSVLYAIKTGYGSDYNAIFVGDGRQAIKAVLLNLVDKLNKRKIYLPSYLCNSILQPFKELSLKFDFYGHFPHLTPNIDYSIKNSLIYIIDYFGIEALSNKEIEELSDSNLIILDITHSIFNKKRFKIKNENVIMIASLRKVFPIPDGGVIYCKNSINIKKLQYDGYVKMLEAMFLKKYYININNDESLKEYFLKLYRSYEKLKDNNNIKVYEIPQISVEILRNLNIKNILLKRKENLDYIYKNLVDNDIFATLFKREEIKSPFFMPLLFKNEKLREIYRKKLINSNIYPPIHWELPTDIPLTFKYEHDLSKRILSIPIDQRYGLKEMDYIINKLKA